MTTTSFIGPEARMLGKLDNQAELLDADLVCGHLLDDDSIHRKLAAIGNELFSDEDFSDLYDARRGRHSVPPSLLAKVILLQSLEGMSDRETVDRLRCDLRWKVALGLSLQDEGFHHTVLTYFRVRLRNSDRPRRIFDRFKEIATEAGLLSARGVRVLDSTPVVSAVQTQDTVSLIKGCDPPSAYAAAEAGAEDEGGDRGRLSSRRLRLAEEGRHRLGRRGGPCRARGRACA
jgi:transposase